LHIGSVVVLCERLEIIIKSGGLAIHFRGEAHSLVSFAGMVEDIEAEKCLEKALSLEADDVFGNYWWYAINIKVCFRSYDNVATHTFVHKTKGHTTAKKWMLLCAELWALRGHD
jgi:hypothetical protein